MSGPPSRLRAVLGHLGLVDKATPGQASEPQQTQQQPEPKPHQHHLHPLSPTFFLERAASIEPDAEAVVHVTANGKTLRRSYAELADRARGLAYFLLAKGYRRVGILAPNTPAFLETIFGVGAVPGAVIVPVNYRLKPEDVSYILGFAEVDCVMVDAEFVDLLAQFRSEHPAVHVIVDTDTDATEGELSGPFDEAVLEGLDLDRQGGGRGDDTIAIPFTSGTTSKPKGVVYTHRGAYLATLANVVESGLNFHDGRRCRYLWTLPMFHAVGWTFPWAVTAVRGTHVCLRRVDYGLIWRLLREEGVTHFNAAPTVCTLLCAAPEASAGPPLPGPVRVTVAASPPTAHLFAQMTALNLRPVHVYGMTETYGPITKGYYMPAWDDLPPADRYALMARQGHGFLTSLPIRVVKTPAEDEQALHQSHHDGIYQQQLQQQPNQPSDVLVDVNKDGKEIGEIVFLGNICAKGYYKDPEATAKLFAGGALHSGDLAVWHPDGSAQILDRAKDIIISGKLSHRLPVQLLPHP
ncbi:AMP-binding domain-containing protein [Magnaporthiopsis poae ATCC 64411]|uniref:AMP-binding domain-containing protein n=1 Tax=Magnaporthiopsis poae (strain ATCC 64411 / 73-15) TaxID=644358 RepID=A0A0C4E385_MAGP6|nr:AMP-binding domain-containing protein [Magnaporthiopsis poae ATCC 64411]